MRYTERSDSAHIGKESATYEFLGGRDSIKLEPFYIDYVTREITHDGWESSRIDGGEGRDSLSINHYHLEEIANTTSVELGELVDDWTPLSVVIDNFTYTCEIKSIERLRNIVTFKGNSEGNHVESMRSDIFDFSFEGGAGNDTFIIDNDDSGHREGTQSIYVNTGAGDDVVTIVTNTDRVILDLEGGEGEDALILGDASNAAYLGCIPCEKITLDGLDSANGFEFISFVENVKQRAFISNEFLINTESDSLYFEGDKHAKIVFTDDIEKVHDDDDDECEDGYIHYQLEVPVEEGFISLENTEMMNIWIDSDIWVS